MFYILVTIIFLLPVLAGWGFFFEKVFGKIWNGISSKLLSGILSITVIWTIIAFFFPLNIYIEISSILFGLFFFLKNKLYRNFFLFFEENSVKFPLIVLIILFFGSFHPYILDHFGYYVPTIKWLSEVGLVKGISNLDLILGQMSLWHIFQAGFSNFTDSFFRINVVVLITYSFYIFERKSLFHLIFFPILFLFLQSPSPDLPVIVFSLILLNEILIKNKNIALLFTFSVFVFAIKPTMIWLPVLTVLYGFIILKANFKFMFGGLFLLILFCVKNIWTFGYPIFPVQMFDFGISWKPNQELLNNSAKLAIEKTYDLQFTYDQIQKFSSFDFIKNWLFLKGLKSKIHIIFVLSLITFIIFSFIKKKKIISIICISILIKSIFVLSFSAQYRFFIDVFFVIFFVLLYQVISQKMQWVLFLAGSFIVGYFLSFPKFLQENMASFRLGFFMRGFHKKQAYKPSVYELKKYKTYQIGNLKFNVVEDYPFSFDTPIPAISPGFLWECYDAGIFPQPNSSNIKDGFHWRKLTASEKNQLKKILKELKFPNAKNSSRAN